MAVRFWLAPGSRPSWLAATVVLIGLGSSATRAQVAAPAVTALPLPPPPAPGRALAIVPGQTIQPIDLATALRLAGARRPRHRHRAQQVMEALGELDQARGLWLPSLFTGPTYYRVDGQVQSINGQVITTSRSSLFLGTTASLANSFPACATGQRLPPLNSLSGVLRLSDAALRHPRSTAGNRGEPGRGRRRDQQRLAGGLRGLFRPPARRREAGHHPRGRRQRRGAGEHHRHLRPHRRRPRGRPPPHPHRAAEPPAVDQAGGRPVSRSPPPTWCRPLLLDPHVVIAPVEPAETVITLIPDSVPLDDLICQGWRNRPELTRARELVEASVLRLKQAKLRPFVPSLAVTYSGGGFGGGQNTFFGDFNTRGDASASLFWELRGLGLSDYGVWREAQAQRRTADIDLVARAGPGRQRRGRLLPRPRRVLRGHDRGPRRGDRGRRVADLEPHQHPPRRRPPRRTRPIEVLQPIQALAQARTDYLDAVLAHNRAQVRLFHALGRPVQACGVCTSAPPRPVAERCPATLREPPDPACHGCHWRLVHQCQGPGPRVAHGVRSRMASFRTAAQILVPGAPESARLCSVENLGGVRRKGRARLRQHREFPWTRGAYARPLAQIPRFSTEQHAFLSLRPRGPGRPLSSPTQSALRILWHGATRSVIPSGARHRSCGTVPQVP